MKIFLLNLLMRKNLQNIQGDIKQNASFRNRHCLLITKNWIYQKSLKPPWMA
jgi:hypothetical protein